MSNLQATKRLPRAMSVRELLSLDEYLHDQVDEKERTQRGGGRQIRARKIVFDK